MAKTTISQGQKASKTPGRPTRSPSGRRQTLHITLSPEALEALERIRHRPIASISQSEMIDHLIIAYDGVERTVKRLTES
jgi:hypothetical protein